MAAETIFSDFIARLEGIGRQRDPAYVRAWEQFHVWLHSARAACAIRYLDVMEPVLGYEVNRPYKYWYGSLEPLELTDNQKRLVYRLGEKKEVDAYLEKGGKGQ